MPHEQIFIRDETENQLMTKVGTQAKSNFNVKPYDQQHNYLNMKFHQLEIDIENMNNSLEGNGPGLNKMSDTHDD